MKYFVLTLLIFTSCFNLLGQDLIHLKSGHYIKGVILDTLENGDLKIILRKNKEVILPGRTVERISKDTLNLYNFYHHYKEFPKYQFVTELGRYFTNEESAGVKYNMIYGAQFNPYVFGGINLGLKHEPNTFFFLSVMSDFRFTLPAQYVKPFIGIGAGGIFNPSAYQPSRFQPIVSEWKLLLGFNLGALASLNDRIDFVTSLGYETEFEKKYINYNFGLAFKFK